MKQQNESAAEGLTRRVLGSKSLSEDQQAALLREIAEHLARQEVVIVRTGRPKERTDT